MLSHELVETGELQVAYLETYPLGQVIAQAKQSRAGEECFPQASWQSDKPKSM
jgi:hypothetical protein